MRRKERHVQTAHDIPAPEPQRWKGLYTIASVVIALIGTVPAIVAWTYWNDPGLVSWKMLAIVLTLMWAGFFGTPWMAWAFARRWLRWKLGEQERAQRRFENALTDNFEKALASLRAQLDEEVKPFSEETERIELTG